MISQTIQAQIKEAMKARDSVRLSTLKMLSAELHNAAIDNHGELNEEQEIAVVKKEAKKRRDAIEAYEKAGSADRAENEKKELEILQEFLPAEMSDEDLGKVISEIIAETRASNMADMGKVMSAVMAKTNGQANGSRVSAMVREKLSS